MEVKLLIFSKRFFKLLQYYCCHFVIVFKMLHVSVMYMLSHWSTLFAMSGQWQPCFQRHYISGDQSKIIPILHTHHFVWIMSKIICTQAIVHEVKCFYSYWKSSSALNLGNILICFPNLTEKPFSALIYAMMNELSWIFA